MAYKYFINNTLANVLFGLLLLPILIIIIISLFRGEFLLALHDYWIVYLLTFGFSFALWAAISFGSYVFIDNKKRMLIVSEMFDKKKIKIDDIVKIGKIFVSKAVVAAPIPKIIFTFHDLAGKLKTIQTASKDMFKKGEFEKFINELQAVNPNIEISKDIFEKWSLKNKTTAEGKKNEGRITWSQFILSAVSIILIISAPNIFKVLGFKGTLLIIIVFFFLYTSIKIFTTRKNKNIQK